MSTHDDLSLGASRQAPLDLAQFSSVEALPQTEFIYALPQRLIETLRRAAPQMETYRPKWEGEMRLAEWARTLQHCVGFHAGRPIGHDLLQMNPPANADVREAWADMSADPSWDGITPAKLQVVLETANERLDWINSVAKAYCGWLLTNPTFLHEHAQLLHAHKETIGLVGFQTMGSRHEESTLWLVASNGGRAVRSLVQAQQAFCERWHLEGLAGPYLPQPIRPQIPILKMSDLMRKCGASVYLPYTFSLLKEDELRQLLEDVIHGVRAPEHLKGWMETAGSSRVNKQKEFTALARRFEIQHFLRVIEDRWGTELREQRVKEKIGPAFEDYFGLASSITTDMKKIRRAWRKMRAFVSD